MTGALRPGERRKSRTTHPNICLVIWGKQSFLPVRGWAVGGKPICVHEEKLRSRDSLGVALGEPLVRGEEEFSAGELLDDQLGG